MSKLRVQPEPFLLALQRRHRHLSPYHKMVLEFLLEFSHMKNRPFDKVDSVYSRKVLTAGKQRSVR